MYVVDVSSSRQLHCYIYIYIIQKVLLRYHLGPFTPGIKVNSAMTLAIWFLLKTMDSLENWLQPQSGADAKVESLAPLQSCSNDADTFRSGPLLSGTRIFL